MRGPRDQRGNRRVVETGPILDSWMYIDQSIATRFERLRSGLPAQAGPLEVGG